MLVLRANGVESEAERVALVFAARDGDPRDFPADGLPELRLEGLAVEDAAALLAGAGDRLGAGAGALEEAEAAGLVRVTRTYTFPGGCITERFVSPDSPERLASEDSSSFGFVTRDEVAHDLSRRSDGRLRLDPA